MGINPPLLFGESGVISGEVNFMSVTCPLFYTKSDSYPRIFRIGFKAGGDWSLFRGAYRPLHQSESGSPARGEERLYL